MRVPDSNTGKANRKGPRPGEAADRVREENVYLLNTGINRCFCTTRTNVIRRMI